MSKVSDKDSYSGKFIKAQKVKEHWKGREGKEEKKRRGEGRRKGIEWKGRKGKNIKPQQ